MISRLCLSGLAAYMIFSLTPAFADPDPGYRQRQPDDEVIYFALPDRFANGGASNDRGGIPGGVLDHGFAPTRKGFFHGGDLKGLTAHLDYIQGLGATAIWLGPIYKNKPVQGPAGEESAAYHGYWITDFTDVDPHFGSRKDLKALVDAAHSRGIKVYLDIVTNHTADVIAYRECASPARAATESPHRESCPYRSKADYPYGTRGDAGGPRINAGFMGDAPPFQTAANFARLTRSDYAYTPYVPAGETHVKKPEWLNDIRYYHNRGNSTFEGESATYGDFSGLDDLMTEDPRVVSGFIDIYKAWITDFRIDGFRVDTARHVNLEFWRKFAPAMIEHAAALGIPNFYIFGEYADPDAGDLARFTRTSGMPYVLDFAFQSVATDVLANEAPTDRLAGLFAADALYDGGAERALSLPVFLGNHDMGRFATFLRAARPDASPSELFKRLELGEAMTFFLRGAPVIYYGDEQGFVGDGGDQDAREDMFASKVASYNDNVLIGTNATTASDNFNPDHPVYKAIAGMAKIYAANKPLRRGAQIVRLSEADGGVFAISRLARNGGEYLVVFNTRNEDRDVQIETDTRSSSWTSITGSCLPTSTAPGSYHVKLAPLDYVICKSNVWSAE